MSENTTQKTRRWGRVAAIVGAPLLLAGGCVGGAAIGLTANPEDMEPRTVTETVTETPEPKEVTVTETPEPEVVTETETKEVEVEVEKAVVPQECLDALTDAETVTDYNSDALSLAGDAIVAAATGDTATLDSITGQINGMKDEMTPYVNSYVTNAELCRTAEEEE